MSATAKIETPFLRTLAPLLQGLERRLRAWLDARHLFPVSTVHRAEVQGLADDLNRKSESLDVDHPLLVIMLMGGTGVGKSTLMNALAGAAVAQASFTRPTTRDPVVYFHQSIPADRLDPALRLCRLIRHDRAALAHKIIVDTPDVDSNDLANREKLISLLPVADVALYIGSQEKYHDQLVWDLFKEQRQRRAFAFVLNKWDRCVETTSTGVRPDEDLLADLRAEGFQNPKLFRTTAQLWVDAALERRSLLPNELPPGEQFQELLTWLEEGLTRLEIESVKARGVEQLLTQVLTTTQAITPPDLTKQSERVTESWTKILGDEINSTAEVLVGSIDPHQVEIEQQFNVRGQQRFRGLMAAYLRLTTMRYSWRPIRDRMSLPTSTRSEPKAEDVDLASFAHGCARSAGERVLDQRRQALVNKLLLNANQNGFPLTVLSERTKSVAKLDWDDRFTYSVVESLMELEREVTNPVGWQAYLRGGVQRIANLLPETVLIASIFVLLWRFFVEDYTPSMFHVTLPFFVTLGTLILLHVLISIVFPVRWNLIREEFQEKLTARLENTYKRAFLPVPAEIATKILQDREAVEAIRNETLEIIDWLTQRESAVQVTDLYGR